MRISYTRILQAIKYLSKVKDELKGIYQTIQMKTANAVAIKKNTQRSFLDIGNMTHVFRPAHENVLNCWKLYLYYIALKVNS